MHSWLRGAYELSTDPDRIDTALVQRFLATSYWARGVPRAIVDRACRGSLCFGLYRVSQASPSRDEQVGFARVVTDYATFGYLADVFVLEAHRGRGLSKWMVGCVLAHEELQGFKRWMLATRDAHSLYARFGFAPLGEPAKFMEISRPGVYREADAGAGSAA